MELLSERKGEEFWNQQEMSTLDLTKRNMSQSNTQFIGRTWRVLGNMLLQSYAMLQGAFSHVYPAATCLLSRTQSQGAW